MPQMMPVPWVLFYFFVSFVLVCFLASMWWVEIWEVVCLDLKSKNKSSYTYYMNELKKEKSLDLEVFIEC